MYEHKTLVLKFNELYEIKNKELKSNYHRILNKIKHLYSEFSKNRLKIQNDQIAKYQEFVKNSILRLEKHSLYVIPSISCVVNKTTDTDDLEIIQTENSTQFNDLQMKNRLTKEFNKLMDSINKHCSSTMAKLEVDKNKDIESLKQKYIDLMTLFLKHFSHIAIEESFRNILLINQFSLEYMRIMKSKKDDTIAKLTQQISDLKQFNTNIYL